MGSAADTSTILGRKESPPASLFSMAALMKKPDSNKARPSDSLSSSVTSSSVTTSPAADVTSNAAAAASTPGFHPGFLPSLGMG